MLFSLGLFLLVINAIILKIIPHFVQGFHVPSFTSAFFGVDFAEYYHGAFHRLGDSGRTRVLRVNHASLTGMSLMFS